MYWQLRVEPARTHVGVVIEVEAKLQQQAALDVCILEANITGHSPNRAEENRIMRGERVLLCPGKRLTGLEKALCPELELRALECHIATDENRIEHAVRLANDLGPDPVAWNDCELDGSWHGCSFCVFGVRSLA